jgi:SPP1 family predicted phage head-tail adaptor
MQAGKLRHRVTVQRLTPVQDPLTGVVSDTWTDHATVWASIEPLSAREFLQAAALASLVVARIRIRNLSGVMPSMRIVHGERTYNIEGVLADRDSGAEYLTLPVSEVVHG